MRTMLRWTMPVEQGNLGIKNGAIQKSVESMMQSLEPEAAYFFVEGGLRGGMIIFDMTDSSQIPLIAEPLFQDLNASVEFMPVMNGDDLQRALGSI